MLVNEYEITEKRYIQWVYESKREGRKLFFMIFWGVLTLICILSAVIFHDYLFLLFGVYCLYRAVLRDIVVSKAFFRKKISSCNGNKWIRTIQITKDDIVIKDGNTVVEYKNSDIVKSTQNDERIRLFMKDNTSVRLYMDSFISGNIEEYLDMECWKPGN